MGEKLETVVYFVIKVIDSYVVSWEYNLRSDSKVPATNSHYEYAYHFTDYNLCASVTNLLNTCGYNATIIKVITDLFEVVGA